MTPVCTAVFSLSIGNRLSASLVRADQTVASSGTGNAVQLYLDDNSVDSALIRLLAAAGHDVMIPATARIAGQEDVVHLIARDSNRQTIADP
jgi:hypothetical protein